MPKNAIEFRLIILICSTFLLTSSSKAVVLLGCVGATYGGTRILWVDVIGNLRKMGGENNGF